MKSQLASYLRSTRERAFMRAEIVAKFSEDLSQIVLHGQITPMRELVEYLLASSKGKAKTDKTRLMRDLICQLGVLDSTLKRGTALRGVKTMEAAASIMEAFTVGVESIYPDIIRVEKSEEEKEADRLQKIAKAISFLKKEITEEELLLLFRKEEEEATA